MARPRTVSDAEAVARARHCIVEHGPGVTLAVLAKAVGLSPPAIIKRFGAKEHLVCRALLPPEPPRWPERLEANPADDAVEVLTEVLIELCEGFRSVGPAFAALRMSDLEVNEVFPGDEPGPPLVARGLLAAWLCRAGVGAEAVVLADAGVGAAEARGFLQWVGPQMVTGTDRRWANLLARHLLGDAIREAAQSDDPSRS